MARSIDGTRTALDATDAAILRIAQQDNRVSTSKIAEAVSLSASAVQRRLTKLRDDGVIARECCIVAPEAVGKAYLAFVHVTLDTDRADLARAFRHAMQSAPEVLLLSYVKTDVDYVLLVAAADAAAFRAFADEKLSGAASVRRFSAYPVLESLKWSLELAL